MYDDRYVRRRAVPSSHTSSVIFCHGRGQKGSDWLSMVDQLRALACLDHVAFVFPYLSYSGEASSQASSSVSLVQTIVAEEIKKGIAAGRIAVAGMGEGAAVALKAVLTNPSKITAVAGLGLTRADDSPIVAKRAPAQAQTPVLIACHGEIGAAAATMSLAEKLEAAGQPVEVITHDSVSSLDVKNGLLTQQVCLFVCLFCLDVEILPG
jgi:predicted esterase